MFKREEVAIDPAKQYRVLVTPGTDAQSIRAGVSKIFTDQAKGKILPSHGIAGTCLLVTGMDEATAADVRRLRRVSAIAAVQGAKPA
jgi:hypothetical protein